MEHLWLVLAIAASALYALSNLVDARLVRNVLRDPLAITALVGLSFIVVAILFICLHGITWIGWQSTSLAFGTGLISVLVYYPYFLALQKADTARVLQLWNLTPLFIVIFAWGLFREQLPWVDYVGVMLLIMSASIAGMIRKEKQTTSARTSVILTMLFASILYALQNVFQKILYTQAGFEQGYIYFSFASFLAGLLIIALSTPTRQHLRTQFSWRTGKLYMITQGLDLTAGVTAGYAISLGSVSVVNAVGGLQPILIIFFEYCLFRFGLAHTRPHTSILFWLSCVLAITGLFLVRSLAY